MGRGFCFPPNWMWNCANHFNSTGSNLHVRVYTRLETIFILRKVIREWMVSKKRPKHCYVIWKWSLTNKLKKCCCAIESEDRLGEHQNFEHPLCFFGREFFGREFFGREFFGREFFGREFLGREFFGREFFRKEFFQRK